MPSIHVSFLVVSCCIPVYKGVEVIEEVQVERLMLTLWIRRVNERCRKTLQRNYLVINKATLSVKESDNTSGYGCEECKGEVTLWWIVDKVIALSDKEIHCYTTFGRPVALARLSAMDADGAGDSGTSRSLTS